MNLVIGFALMIGCTVAANVFLKAGAMVPPSERVILGIADWKMMLGFALFGASGLVHAWILNWVPLNVAQSIAASQFVAVILASALILSEPIPPVRLLGIVLIAAGIVLVSSTGGHHTSRARRQCAAVRTDANECRRGHSCSPLRSGVP